MNLRELFTKYPLDCESFGAEWLRRWEALGKLLEAPALVGVRQSGSNRTEWYRTGNRYGRSVGKCLEHAHERRKFDNQLPIVVALLDGTVIREWGAL